jgi:hypothetical protein
MVLGHVGGVATSASSRIFDFVWLTVKSLTDLATLTGDEIIIVVLLNSFLVILTPVAALQWTRRRCRARAATC